MRKRSTIVLAVSALVLGLTALSAAAAPSDPFVGTWTSIDVDDSNQRLAFGARGDRARLLDDNATGACATGGRFIGHFTGDVSEDRSRNDLTLVAARCQDGTDTSHLLGTVLSLEHDPDTDTLTDNFGVVWHR